MRTIQVVAGILLRDSKLLVAERPKDKPYSGYWEFPGGKIEPGESGESALIRELYEELGVRVHSAKFCFEHQHDYSDKKVSLEIWRVDQFSGEPQSKENQTLRWVDWPELLSLHLLEGNIAILPRLEWIAKPL